MSEEIPLTRRYYFDAYALTYNQNGWALLHKEDGFLASDQFPTVLKEMEYKDGRLLSDVVKEAMEQELGDPI